MNEIKKLTDTIRNYSESELCYGTVVTLSKIDNEANRLEQENAELRQQVEAMREAQTKALDVQESPTRSPDMLADTDHSYSVAHRRYYKSELPRIEKKISEIESKKARKSASNE